MGEMLVPLPRYPNWQRGDEHGAKVVAFLLGAVSHYAAAPWRAHTMTVRSNSSLGKLMLGMGVLGLYIFSWLAAG